MAIKDKIKNILYQPQPLNYNRVSGSERELYEWLLKYNIITEVYFSKDSHEYYVSYHLWKH